VEELEVVDLEEDHLGVEVVEVEGATFVFIIKFNYKKFEFEFEFKDY